MGIFDSLKRQAESAVRREASKAVNNAVKGAAQAVAKGRNHDETFTFAAVPANVAQLQALPEASLDSAFKTTALTLLALCRYEQDPAACIEMLNFLKGPEDVSTYEKQFIQERLKGKEYNCTVAPRDQRWMRIECDFRGDIAVLGVDGDEFADCPLQLSEWKKMLVRRNDDED